jgi:hypothetical protein
MNTNKLIPAFPTWIQDDSMAQGMSLRDYFAAAALTGFAVQGGELSQMAEDAYVVADAMMEARK